MPYQRNSVTDKTRLKRAYNRYKDYYVLAKNLNIKRGTAYGIISRSMGRDGLAKTGAIGVHWWTVLWLLKWLKLFNLIHLSL